MAVVVRRKQYAKKATKRPASRAAVVKLIRKELTMEAEKKTYDTYSNAFPSVPDQPDYNGIMYHLSGVNQGVVGQQDRTGDVIEYHKLQMKLVAYAGTLATVPIQFSLRVVIFKWRPQILTPPLGVTAIMENYASVYVGSGYITQAPLNKENEKLYTVLYDKLHIPHNDSNGSLSLDLSIPLKGRSRFATTTTVQEDGIQMVIFSDTSSSMTSAPPQVSFVSRLTYTNV